VDLSKITKVLAENNEDLAENNELKYTLTSLFDQSKVVLSSKIEHK